MLLNWPRRRRKPTVKGNIGKGTVCNIAKIAGRPKATGRLRQIADIRCILYFYLCTFPISQTQRVYHSLSKVLFKLSLTLLVRYRSSHPVFTLAVIYRGGTFTVLMKRTHAVYIFLRGNGNEACTPNSMPLAVLQTKDTAHTTCNGNLL